MEGQPAHYPVPHLVKERLIRLHDQALEIRYFSNTDLHGAVRYSSEVSFGPYDKLIIDDRTMGHLEEKLLRLLPLSLLCRMIGGPGAAHHRHE